MLSLQRERRWHLLGEERRGCPGVSGFGYPRKAPNLHPVDSGISARECMGSREDRRLKEGDRRGSRIRDHSEPVCLPRAPHKAFLSRVLEGAQASPGGVCGWINQQSVPGRAQSAVTAILTSNWDTPRPLHPPLQQRPHITCLPSPCHSRSGDMGDTGTRSRWHSAGDRGRMWSIAPLRFPVPHAVWEQDGRSSPHTRCCCQGFISRFVPSRGQPD